MTSKFRTTHLFQILTLLEQQKLPMDVFVKNYFKEHKSIGSHDRKYLTETLYALIRWKGLVDFFCKDNTSWENRVSIFENLYPEEQLHNAQIPLHTRLSFPKNYFDYLCKFIGEKKTQEFCLESNYAAPTTIRSNPLKISREALLSRFQGIYDCTAGTTSPFAIHFSQRVNFFTLPEFKEGYFEVQDEGSQLAALEVQALPGDHVLDYCSGSGGKTLAIAPSMKGKGQIYLHDIRPHILVEAKKRLKRAGIQNAQFVNVQDPNKKKLRHRMDWVLTDVPCSGSGTLRRNADMKWKFQEENIKELVQIQRKIFEEAFSFLKPEGHIVYATCSVLPEENDLQIAFFLENFPLRLVKPPFQSFPKRGAMDGFYSATLQKY